MNTLQKQIINGRYELLTQIGAGGYGQVYLATDLLTQQPCVLKRNTAMDEDAHRRFFAEAQTLAQLAHQALPKVTDFFSHHEAGDFLVMELIPGRALTPIIKVDGTKNLAEIKPWVEDIFSAVSYLHAQNIIHRDIKPDNILAVSQQDAYLVDFGIAKPAEKTYQSEMKIISRGYSPPEQYHSAEASPQSDIYSLGAVIYFLLTGHHPTDSHAREKFNESTPSLESVTGSAEYVLQATLDKAMALDPANRWATVSQFWRALYGDSAELPAPKKEIKTFVDTEYLNNPLYAQYDVNRTEAVTSSPFTNTILSMPVNSETVQEKPIEKDHNNKNRFATIGIIGFLLFCAILTDQFINNRPISPENATDEVLNGETRLLLETEDNLFPISITTLQKETVFLEEWLNYAPDYNGVYFITDTTYDPENNWLYFVTTQQYIYWIDLDTQEMERIDLSDFINSYTSDFDHITWMGNDKFGLAGNDLYIYDRKQETLKKVDTIEYIQHSFLQVDDMTADNKGNLYIVDSIKKENKLMYDDRLHIISPEGDIIHEEILPTLIEAIAVDDSGGIWLGSLHNSLWKQEKGSAEWVELLDSFNLSVMKDMAFNAQGNLWITTYKDEPLLRYSVENNQLDVIIQGTDEEITDEDTWDLGTWKSPKGIVPIGNDSLFVIDGSLEQQHLIKITVNEFSTGR